MSRKSDPTKGNVTQFPGEFSEKPDDWHRDRVDELCPDDFNLPELVIWRRVAFDLSKVGRLKELYVDVIAEYCRVHTRLAQAREYLDDEDWTYITTGRHGKQIKSRPEVAQLNDDWRKWRSLFTELGMSPASEKNLKSLQGDLFGPDPFNNF